MCLKQFLYLAEIFQILLTAEHRNTRNLVKFILNLLNLY